MRFLPLVLLVPALMLAQDAPAPAQPPQAQEGSEAPARLTVPAGTKIPLVLKHAISTKSVRPGDPVYLETSFPVARNNRMLIPAGTYVQGVVDNVKRPGRVKGRAELQIHFTTLIFPNGYTVNVPGAVDSAPGLDDSHVKNKEGTIQAEGQKGKDVGTIAETAGTGTLIGGLSNGAKGAGIGAGLGGAVGLATVLLTRGQEVRMEAGSTLEMELQRPLFLEEARVANTSRELLPVNQGRRLQHPPPNPPPDPR